jgi:hypothetical protein
MLNNLRCLALVAAALLGLQSVEAAEKAPATKDTVVSRYGHGNRRIPAECRQAASQGNRS